MAIAYDSSSQGTIPAASTGTWSHTCSGVNRYLFVFTDTASTNVTYNGVPLTVITNNIVTGNGGSGYIPGITVWGMSNPPVGTYLISVTNNYSASGSYQYDACGAVSYTGVDPNGPDSYATDHTSTISAQTIETEYIYTVTNNSWIASFVKGVGNYARSVIADIGTQRQNYPCNQGYSMCIIDSNAPKTPVAQYSLQAKWETSSGWFSSITYAIKPYLSFGFTGPASGNVNSASTNFTVTPDVAVNGTVTITPSGPGSTGLSPTILTFNNSATPQTFTITPTNSGAITLTITNGCGLNNPSSLTYTAIAVVPVAPTIGTATPLNASASVAFTDNSNGGATITNHTATSSPGGFTGTSATSPITVTGLTNGTGYTFTVTATNSVGTSSASAASNSVTPFVPASSFTLTGPTSGSVRSASTNFTVTPNSTYNGTITITPSGAGSAGLSPIVLTFNLSSAAQTFTITPINSGSITLTPINSNGITNPSNLTYTANPVVPLPPSIGLAERGSSQARVTVGAPTNDGGATITMYTVTSSPGGVTAMASAPGTITVNGLTNGTAYTFTAKATNSVGQSAASSVSNSVTPQADSTNFTNNGPKFNIDRTAGNLISF